MKQKTLLKPNLKLLQIYILIRTLYLKEKVLSMNKINSFEIKPKLKT